MSAKWADDRRKRASRRFQTGAATIGVASITKQRPVDRVAYGAAHASARYLIGPLGLAGFAVVSGSHIPRCVSCGQIPELASGFEQRSDTGDWALVLNHPLWDDPTVLITSSPQNLRQPRRVVRDCEFDSAFAARRSEIVQG